MATGESVLLRTHLRTFASSPPVDLRAPTSVGRALNAGPLANVCRRAVMGAKKNSQAGVTGWEGRANLGTVMVTRTAAATVPALALALGIGLSTDSARASHSPNAAVEATQGPVGGDAQSSQVDDPDADLLLESNLGPEDATNGEFTLGSLHATYRYAGGQKQKEEIQKAIDEALEGLPDSLLGMARKRISKSQQAWPTIQFDVEGQDIRIDRGPEKPVHTTPKKQKVVVFNEHGERYVWTQTISGRTITQTVNGVGNNTKIVYRFSEDGSKVNFSIHIDATLLPSPIKYRLTYKRG